MPEFAPGEGKVALATFPVKPSGLSCEAEIFLGPDDMTKVATSGRIGFTSTGARQDVPLPVTMPVTEGTYHVYVDVYAEGYLIAAYRAIEDVVIAPAVPVEVTSISLSKSSLYEREAFTISITFRNNLDYDLWIRPKFALGRWEDDIFKPEKVLCGWDYVWDRNYDLTALWDWVDLGPLQHAGSGMTNIIYPGYGMSYAYLKVPAKGKATTSRLWYISGGALTKIWGFYWIPLYCTLSPFKNLDVAVMHAENRAITLTYEDDKPKVGSIPIEFSGRLLNACSVYSRENYGACPRCPECGSQNIYCEYGTIPLRGCHCSDCGKGWDWLGT